jgi:hypothetical protein
LTTEERKRVLARLNGRKQVDAFEAAKAIWNDSDKRLERGLLLTLSNGQRPLNRAAAAYAMQLIMTPSTIRALERSVSDQSEHPKVRGYAAEALAPLCANMSETSRPSTITVGRGKKTHFDEHKQDKHFFRCVGSFGA